MRRTWSVPFARNYFYARAMLSQRKLILWIVLTWVAGFAVALTVSIPIARPEQEDLGLWILSMALVTTLITALVYWKVMTKR